MDRLLKIIDHLQGRGQTTTLDLARHLSVSERTIRRDLSRLQEMEIGIITEPGRSGGVRLEGGALLPALRFTDDEALVLALGLKQAPTSGSFSRAAERAFKRLEQVLSPSLRARIDAVQAALQFSGRSNLMADPLSSSTVLALATAIHQQETVKMRYRSAAGRISHRDFDPYGIVWVVNHWYVTGHCHERRAVRTFRVDRLEVTGTTGEFFTVPEGFDPVEAVHQAVGTADPDAVPCEFWVEADLEQVRKWWPSYRARLQEEENGVRVCIQASNRRFRQVALEILDLPCPVKVLGPEEFKQAFAQLSGQALRLAQGEQVSRFSMEF